MQEVKYRLSDGTEVPARLVLKDEDLDLAFLAPLKPLDKATEAKMAFVPLSDSIAPARVARFDDPHQPHRRRPELHPHAQPRQNRVDRVHAANLLLEQQRRSGRARLQSHGKVLGMICRCVKAESERRKQPDAVLGAVQPAHPAGRRHLPSSCRKPKTK